MLKGSYVGVAIGGAGLYEEGSWCVTGGGP